MHGSGRESHLKQTAITKKKRSPVLSAPTSAAPRKAKCPFPYTIVRFSALITTQRSLCPKEILLSSTADNCKTLGYAPCCYNISSVILVRNIKIQQQRQGSVRPRRSRDLAPFTAWAVGGENGCGGSGFWRLGEEPEPGGGLGRQGLSSTCT